MSVPCLLSGSCNVDKTNTKKTTDAHTTSPSNTSFHHLEPFLSVTQFLNLFYHQSLPFVQQICHLLDVANKALAESYK